MITTAREVYTMYKRTKKMCHLENPPAATLIND
jgi:hypothetical protein